MNQQINDYIKQARTTGQTDEQIKQALAQSGWNQIQINEAFGVPVPPSTPVAPSAPNAPSAPQTPGADFLDKKTKDSVTWSAIGYGIKSVIVTIAGALAYRMLMPSSVSIYGFTVPFANPYSHVDYVSPIIWGIISGAITGIILSKLYVQIQNINHSYFGGWFNSLFKLLFYPAVVGSILAAFLAGGLSFSFFGSGYAGSSFMYFLVLIVGELIGSFIYAKIMVMKVGQYYN